MTPKLPVATAKQVARVAQRLGFEFRRQSGSHAIYVRNADHARVAIPMHSGQVLKRKTLRGIIAGSANYYRRVRESAVNGEGRTLRNSRSLRMARLEAVTSTRETCPTISKNI